MRTFVRLVVDHPVATTMVFLAALVFGWVSQQRLPIELMPDIGYPTITVRTALDGAAPQEIESQVSRPIEEALSTLDGLVTLESRSRPGASEVVLGFDWGTDMSAASQSIRESLQTTLLPETADRPLILRYDPSLEPFLRIALSIDPDSDDGLPTGDAALFLLRTLAEDVIQRELEGIPGVAAVRVEGGLEREIRVEVHESWLAARRVTLEQVRRALADENVNIAGGSIIEGDVTYLVRTLNEFRRVDELEDIEVRRDDGVLVPLVDVAELHEGHRDRQLVNRMNGGEAVELEVYKEADANVVEVARRVKAAFEAESPPEGEPDTHNEAGGLRARLPKGVELHVLDDQAAFIESAIGNVTESAIVGGLLAVVVLFLFLRDWRTTAIISLAIPVSIVAGFAPLYLLGVSLNLMSLGGLALGVGMLVDNAVVVLESVQRYLDDGVGRKEAAVLGTSEVAAAVTASTLTTVGVFAPIAFVEGVAGELFGDLATAVCASLLASLAVGLTLVPMLAALDPIRDRPVDRDGLVGLLAWRDGEGARAWWRRVRGEVVGPPVAEWRATRGWMRERRRRRALVLVAAPVLVLSVVARTALASGVLLVGLASRVGVRIGRRLLGPLARGTVAAADAFQRRYAAVAATYERTLVGALRRPGTVLGVAVLLSVASLALGTQLGTELLPELHQGRFTVDLALPVGTPLDRTLRAVGDAEKNILAIDRVRSVYASVGYDPRVETRSDQGEHTAELRVQLEPGASARAEDRAMQDVRRALAGLELATAKVERPALFSFRTPVEVVLYTWDLDAQADLGKQVADRLRSEPGLVDVRSSLVAGHPEIRILYDRQRLHRLGLDPATVAERVREKVQGVEATRIQRGEQRVSLLVQLVAPDRATVQDLRDININPALQPAIPLSAVADFSEAVGPSEIRRIDQQRAVVVSANLAGFDLGTVAARIDHALASVAMPPGVVTEVVGQSSEMKASLASLRFALGLAVFLVYVIMASTFESLFDPFVILFSVPLAIVGAVFALFVAGDPISVVVLIGAIVLVGVVVNNAIVLIDAIHRIRDEGTPLDEAIRQGGALRLRPILITTITSVLGLLPLSLGFGAGAEMQGPLAVTVMGGLVSSTFLTLFVVPTLYRLLVRVSVRAS